MASCKGYRAGKVKELCKFYDFTSASGSGAFCGIMLKLRDARLRGLRCIRIILRLDPAEESCFPAAGL